MSLMDDLHEAEQKVTDGKAAESEVAKLRAQIDAAEKEKAAAEEKLNGGSAHTSWI